MEDKSVWSGKLPETAISDEDDNSLNGSNEDEVDCEEDLDPRVQGELETLNSASDDINTLETELEKSRTKFRSILAESTQSLNALYKKLGKCVLKARPYYMLLNDCKKAQVEVRKVVNKFHKANEVYQAAKEMVQLAEERNFQDVDDSRRLDSAWQEMLNHATMKFMSAEHEKTVSEQAHMEITAKYAALQMKLNLLLKDMPRNISKAKIYFDMKDRLEEKLQVQRQNVEDLQMGLVCAKHKYRAALTNLEAISEEIHSMRKKRLRLPPRTPGVGAESDTSSLPSICLDNLSDTVSFVSLDDLDSDWASMKEEDRDSLKDTHDIHTGPLGHRQAVAEGAEGNSSSLHREESEKLTQRQGNISSHMNQAAVAGHPSSSLRTDGIVVTEHEKILPDGQTQSNLKYVQPQSQASVKGASKNMQWKMKSSTAFPILLGLMGSEQNRRQPGFEQHPAYRNQPAYQHACPIQPSEPARPSTFTTDSSHQQHIPSNTYLTKQHQPSSKSNVATEIDSEEAKKEEVFV